MRSPRGACRDKEQAKQRNEKRRHDAHLTAKQALVAMMT